MPTIGEYLADTGGLRPNPTDALAHLDQFGDTLFSRVLAILAKEGRDINEMEWAEIERMMWETYTFSQYMLAQYREAGWTEVFKAGGTYYEHPGGARVSLDLFQGADVPYEWTIEDVMNELNEYLAAAQSSPEKAVLFALERMPEPQRAEYKLAVTERIIMRKFRTAADWLQVEWDDKQFVKSIDEFEKLVAECFRNRELWKRVTNAVFDEQMITTHMQDLLASLVAYAEDEERGGENRYQPALIKFRQVCSNLYKYIPKARSLALTLSKLAEKLHLRRSVYTDLSDIALHLDFLYSDVKGSLAIIAGGEYTGEVVASLESYANTIEIIMGKARAVNNAIVNMPSLHPEFEWKLELWRSFDIRPEKAEAMEKLPEIYKSIYVVIEIMRDGILEALQLMPHAPSEAELKDRAAEKYDTKLGDAASGELEELRKDFWDVDMERGETVANVKMVNYCVYGFSDKLKNRLKEIGIYTPELWSDFEEAQTKIFAPAKESAERVWGHFVQEHFASWVSRNR